MGKGTYSRRSLFQSFLPSDKKTEFKEDTLFEKFGRKKSGARIYDEQIVPYEKLKEREEETDNGLGAERIGNITSGLAPYIGNWTFNEAMHLVRRTTYKWNKQFADQLLTMTMDQAVDSLFMFNRVPTTTPVNYYNNISADENNLPLGADWTSDYFVNNANGFGNDTDNYRTASLRRWLFGLVAEQELNLREKLVWFLYHFVPVDFDDVRNSGFSYAATNGARILYSYMKMLRDHCDGNYKDFIKDMCKEPAMMYYLNNHANTKTAPDENFARELMELFTLGKGPDSQYTQSDVIEAAKICTGWRVTGMNAPNVATSFVPNLHHTANKQFSSFFNNQLINYQQGAAGAFEIDQLIEMIFTKDTVVAEYICTRLYRFFVYYDIDANIETNIIKPLAQQFIANNWELAPTLKTLLKSEHFYDMANRGCYIKSPMDVIAGTLGMFHIDITDANDLQGQYYLWSYFNDSRGQSMEQRFGTMPNVAGWNAYYQTPAYHEYWINSVTIQNRERFINDMFGGVNLTISPGNLKSVKIDVLSFAQQWPQAIVQNPDDFVQACVQLILPMDLSLQSKTELKMNTLLSGQTQDYYWTNAWNDYTGNPNDMGFKTIVETRLRNLLLSICRLAENQLM